MQWPPLSDRSRARVNSRPPAVSPVITDRWSRACHSYTTDVSPAARFVRTALGSR
jgi:hypothetical protein